MRLRQVIVLLGLTLAGATLALLLNRRLATRNTIQAVGLPQGDQEVAWLYTSTSNAAWERFVAGAKRTGRMMPGLTVDDSRAFPERSTDVPEVAVSMSGREGKIRIRWYKLSDAANIRDWVRALEERDPAPLAIIGGDTSDRARDLARALSERTQWHGAAPLFFITTATVDELRPEQDPDLPSESPLLKVYPGRTFRFCFSNKQMARAIYDFVWRNPELRPRGPVDLQHLEPEMLTHVLPMFGNSVWDELLPKALLMGPQPGKCFVLGWSDDPYSNDFNASFYEQLNDRTEFRTYQLRYNVGSFDQANQEERKRATEILDAMPAVRGTRTLVVLPAGSRTARRFIRTLTGDAPLIGRRLVVVTGDSISFNTVYRDSEYQWNVRDLPVPLVFFAHANPVAWDEELPPPNGTDDVLQADEMVRVLAEAVYGENDKTIIDADRLAERLRHRTRVPVFDELGNRHGGGEHIVYLRPDIRAFGRVHPTACMTVWRRGRRGNWVTVRPNPLVVPGPAEGYLDCLEDGGDHAPE